MLIQAILCWHVAMCVCPAKLCHLKNVFIELLKLHFKTILLFYAVFSSQNMVFVIGFLTTPAQLSLFLALVSTVLVLNLPTKTNLHSAGTAHC